MYRFLFLFFGLSVVLGFFTALPIPVFGKDPIMVPEKVWRSFEAYYPPQVVNKVYWDKTEMNKETFFIAIFELSKQKTSVYLDTAGYIAEVRTVIESKSFSQGLKQSISQEYAAYKVKEYQQVHYDGNVFWGVLLVKNKEEIHLLYDRSPKLIRKQ